MAIKLNGSTSGSVALDAPADTSPSGTDVTLTLPTSAGSSGQYLQTNGSGALSWAGIGDTGKILQVVQGTLDDAQESTASSTFVDTSLTASITPSATSSKILIITNSIYMNSSSDVNGKLGIKRGSTVLNNGRALAVYYFQASSNVDPWNTGSMMYLDSPATTSSTTYTVVFKCSGGTFYHGHGSGTGGHTQTITLMEVAA